MEIYEASNVPHGLHLESPEHRVDLQIEEQKMDKNAAGESLKIKKT